MTIVFHRLFPALAGLALALATSACGTSDPSRLPAEEVVQSGCEGDDECAGGYCIEGLSNGLCTAECTTQEECPEGTVCTDTEAVAGVCLFPCTSGAECRDMLGDGYTCDEESNLTTGADIRVCIDA